jgi:type I restriction enzyme S subunit
MDSGSAIPSTSRDSFYLLSVNVPPLPEQHVIADILGTFDDKIAINQEMNKTLEKIGQALFKHWFIDFEFPNEEGEPYKSSGGEMVDSELGEIPKGWEIKPLVEVAIFLRGFSYSGAEKFSTPNGYVFITLNNVKEGGGFKPEYAWIKSDRLKEHHFLKEKDLIITNTEQTKDGRLLAFPGIVYFPQDYDGKVGVFSHHITRVVQKDTNSKYFLYYFLLVTQNESVAFHTGSVIWGLDVNSFANHRHVVWAPTDIMIKFEQILENIFEKIILNQKEITALSSIRDSLLPRLMSGKIRVNFGGAS